MAKIKQNKQKNMLLNDIKLKLTQFNKKNYKNKITKNLIIDIVLIEEILPILSKLNINFDIIDIEKISEIDYITEKIKLFDVLIIKNLELLHKNAVKYKNICQLLTYKIFDNQKVDTLFIVFLDKPLEPLFVNNLLYFPSKNKNGEEIPNE